MTYEQGKKWCVYVFCDRFGWGDEWNFKSFRRAMRFAKRKLKDGLGVTITYGKPQYCSNGGERKWKSRKSATSAVAR